MKLTNTQADTLVCALLTWQVGATDDEKDQERLDRALGHLKEELSYDEINALIDQIRYRGEL